MRVDAPEGATRAPLPPDVVRRLEEQLRRQVEGWARCGDVQVHTKQGVWNPKDPRDRFVSTVVYVGTTMYGSPTSVVVTTYSSDPGSDELADCLAEAVLRGTGDLALLNWEPGEEPVALIEPYPHGLPTVGSR